MELKKVISRLDIDYFEDVLSSEVISTLKLHDPKHLYAAGLLKILENTYTNQELLSIKISRNKIIDSLSEIEIISLIDSLGLAGEIKHNYWESVKLLNFNNPLLSKLLLYFNEEFKIEDAEIWCDSIALKPKYPLYDYQRDVLKTIEKTLSTDKNRILLHMPTGSGKTRTAINYICQYLIDNENTNVVWFANSKELLQQAFEEFNKAWTQIGNRELNAIKYWGESRIDLNTLKGSFIVAGLGKMHEALLTNIGKMSAFASTVSLVIMDEAHQAIAPTYKLLLEQILVINKSSLIGLSATPGRTWNDPAEDQKLSNFFYKQKAKIKIDGYTNPVDYLIQNGYLAKTNNIPLLHSSGISLSNEDMTYLKENYVLPEKVLRDISEDYLRNIAIITKVKLLTEKHQRIILFAITKSHAVVLNSLLVAIGLNSKVLTSDTNSYQRSKMIEDFKVPRKDNSESLILCNFGILTTGFDAPETSCAVISRPTDSLVLYSQMVGRAIRGINSGGNLEADIVTVVDENLKGFGEVADAFMNWEDVWENIN